MEEKKFRIQIFRAFQLRRSLEMAPVCNDVRQPSLFFFPDRSLSAVKCDVVTAVRERSSSYWCRV